MDMIGYAMLKVLISNLPIGNTLLHIINVCFTIFTDPSSLHISKLELLQKRKYIQTFNDFRGINICNNLKNIINVLRFNRIKDKFDCVGLDKINENVTKIHTT